MKYLKLGKICDILNGYAFKSSKYTNKGYRVIRITNVQKGVIVDEAPQYYSDKDMEDLKKYELFENDILMSLTGNVGRVGIMDKSLLPAALNQRVACLRLKNQYIYYKYLFYYLNSDKFENICIENSNGIAQKNLSTVFLKDVLIPVPPLETQKKIVEVLDKAQGLIDARKEQIRLMDELIKSVFYEMFGDPVTNPKGWEVKKLGEIGSLERGKSKHRPRNAPELLGGKYPLVQTGDIANAGLYIYDYSQTYSELGLQQSKIWDKGTLCVTIAANIAKTSILGFDACFPDSIVAFIPNENVESMYVQIWFGFLQKIIEANAPESAQKNINLKILRDLDIPLPELYIQKNFCKVIDMIEAERKLLNTSLTELENNYHSMMKKSFGNGL